MTTRQALTHLHDENNFDLIRLLLACMVFAAHTAELSALAVLAPIRGWISTGLAVDGFFVVSGFLIFASFERSASARSYFIKRARRILPAYIAVVLLCAFGLLLVSSLPAKMYFSTEWLKYLAANLGMLNFLRPELPGVFQEQPVSAVNGALWTLKIEAMFYLIVPVLAVFLTRVNKLAGIASIYVFAIFYSFAMNQLAMQTGNELYQAFERQLPGQLAFFISGALLFYFVEFFRARSSRYLILAIIGMALYVLFDWYWVYPISLAVIVVYAAVSLRYLGNWGRFGDLSYGVYIWHFPLIQVFVQSGLLEASPYKGLIGLTLAVFAMAFVSWHIFEKPFLSRRSYYREVARGGFEGSKR